ncbi:MAG: SpoIID/LytB domain-containing protein [Elusimicrobiota bacterium]
MPGSPPRAAAAESLTPASPSEPIIAVGIAHRVPKITVRPEGRFSVIDETTGEMKRLERGRAYTVEADEGERLILGPFLFFGPTRLLPGRPEEYVLIGERKYRGNLVFRPNKDETITVIDELGLEEYLYGVLPTEMSPEWPLEALKAQAVVARTFALNNLGKYSSSGYDLTDDSRSQIYTGITIESVRVRRAVKETAGQVIYWRGKRLPVHFHSCCGGRTTDPASVWGPLRTADAGERGAAESPRPLRGVRDRYCQDTPHYGWTAYFRKDDMLRALQRGGHNVATLTAIKPGRRTSSGYLRYLRLKLDGAWRRVAANDLRMWLGPAELKSTRIRRVTRRRKGFEFAGRGYGHGVGLCQWGARVQAERGGGYRDILGFYFPGAEIGPRER